MANKVSFIIQLKDQFSGVSRKLKNQFKQADTQAKKLDNTLRSRLKRSFGGLNQQVKDAAAGIGAAAAAMGTIKVGAGFQDAIAELSAITGARGAQLDAFSKDILRLSKTFGISQELVAKAVTQTASAKSELLKDPQSLARVTAEALRLSKAAGIGIPDAVSASIGALNQFGAGADQAAKFVNIIAAGAKVGASEIADTAEALKNAGTVASQFGLTFEQTNAVIQVLAKNGVKAAEAGTALRGTLSKLEKFAGGRFAPSRLGIIKSLQIIEKLGLSNNQVIKEFGEENLRSILILRQNVPLIKQWTRELTGTAVATEQADTRMETFNGRLAKAGTALKGIAIKVFTGFEPILSRLVDLFTFLINAIDGVTSALGELIGQFAGAVATFDFSQFDFSAIASRFGEAFGLPEIKIPELFKSPQAKFKIDVKDLPSVSVDLNNIAAGLASPSFSAPTAPNGTIAGQITVKAEPGTSVPAAKLATSGSGLNIGMNMAGAQ